MRRQGLITDRQLLGLQTVVQKISWDLTCLWKCPQCGR